MSSYSAMLAPSQAMLDVIEAAAMATDRCHYKRSNSSVYDSVLLVTDVRVHGVGFTVTFGGASVRMFLGVDDYLYQVVSRDETGREVADVVRLADYTSSQLRTITQTLQGLTAPDGDGIED